jgi:hypothetical protein
MPYIAVRVRSDRGDQPGDPCASRTTDPRRWAERVGEDYDGRMVVAENLMSLPEAAENASRCVERLIRSTPTRSERDT